MKEKYYSVLVLFFCFVVVGCVSQPVKRNATPQATSSVRTTAFEDESNIETPGVVAGEAMDQPDVEVKF